MKKLKIEAYYDDSGEWEYDEKEFVIKGQYDVLQLDLTSSSEFAYLKNKNEEFWASKDNIKWIKFKGVGVIYQQ